MPSKPDNLLSAQLQRKMAELRGKPHLPEAMVAVASMVAELHLEAVPKVRFDGTHGQELPKDVEAAIAAPDAHAQGMPLLPGEKFPLDLRLAEELAETLIRRAPEAAPDLAAPAEALAGDLRGGAHSLRDALAAILADQPVPDGRARDFFSAWEKKHPEAPGFFRFVAQSAVLPSAVVAARLAAKHRDENAMWSHGHCPVCGRLALMGRLKDGEGARMHTCSFCSTEWRAPRIGCPFCLAADPGNASYYSSDDEPGYLIDVCGSCRCYIKLADFRQLDRVWLPALDDLASITLDLHARQMGYTRPTLSAWGF